MLDEPEPGCRLHPHLEVRTSPIAGDGLFAAAAIEAGTVVGRPGRRRADLQERYGEHWVPALLALIRR